MNKLEIAVTHQLIENRNGMVAILTKPWLVRDTKVIFFVSFTINRCVTAPYKEMYQNYCIIVAVS